MKNLVRYAHTLRYLKPIQVFGRIWFRLYRPSVRAAPTMAIRRQAAGWRQPPLKKSSLLSPSRFRFLNEEHEIRDLCTNPLFVTPAKAGVQTSSRQKPGTRNITALDTGFRRYDDLPNFRSNSKLSIQDAADWNNPGGEKLWLYNLHYFDDLNAEGAGQRAVWHRALIERWIAENPVGWGNGWEPYPLSRRIVNWIRWALALEGSEMPPGAADSLAVQARYLRKRIEWHLLGNHLLANAKALIFAGLFFEGPEAEEWLAKGNSIFSRQLKEQVLADGGHFERSPMYHAQVLEDLLDVVNACRTLADRDCRFRGNDKFETLELLLTLGKSSYRRKPVSSLFNTFWTPAFAGVTNKETVQNNRGTAPLFCETLREQCADAAQRMLGWLKVMSHPDGKIALFNDSAFGETAGVEALETYATSLGIRTSDVPAPLPTNGHGRRSSENRGAVPLFRHLEASGYVRVEGGEWVAFLDVAPVGPDYLPGHAHADTLSFELSFGRQRVIVDSGVSQYGNGPERLRQRGTAAHNTVVIDGQNSSEVWGGFRVARRAYPRDLQILPEEGVISCAHDGYRRLPGKPVHRREWRFREAGLQIRDTIEGGFQKATGRLHFHPEVRVVPVSDACDSGRILLPDGRSIHWKIGKGSGRICDTTWHPEFGLSIPNRCLEIAFTERETVVDFAWDSPR